MPKKAYSIAPWWTMLIGIMFNITLIASEWGILAHFEKSNNWITISGLTGFSLILFGYFGLTGIRTAHEGVIKVLGKRLYTFTLSEGAHWKPPFISIEEVDVRERSTKVKDLVFSVGRYTTREDVENSKVQNAGIYHTAEFILSATVLWRVAHPAVFLDIGQEQIMNSLQHQMTDALREIGRRYLPTEFLSIDREILQEAISTIFHRDEEEDEDIATRWGINFHNISVPRIELKDPAMKAAFAKLVQEERERLGEKVAVEHVAAVVKHVMDTTKCNFDQALLAYQRQTGDLPSNEIIITGGTGSLDAAAAMIANPDLIKRKISK